MALDIESIKTRMGKTMDSFKHELGGLRTGRAHTGLLDTIKVEAYGSEVPINQVASVSAPEPRMLSVNVWDRGLAAAVDKAIRASNLGLNPIMEGQTLRIPMPQITEERRKDLTKVASKAAEDAKIAIRNVRRDGMDEIKKLEKDKKVSEDEGHGLGEKVQKVTDDFIKQIETELEKKTKEIMTV